MSEDGAMDFAGWPSPLGSRRAVHADGQATSRLIEAAGWPVAGIGLDRAEPAAIVALDWREAVRGEEALAALPADCALLVLVSLATIDQADALLAGRSTRFVFGGSASLIATELSELDALARVRSAADPGSSERARLQALASELARLAEQLGELSEADESPDSGLADHGLEYQAERPADRRLAPPPTPERIRHLIAMRRLRDRFFRAELFADPAWDILLDLTASRLERRSVSVSSLCIAAAVPPTTALRWIRMMTEQELLERRSDPADARRMFVDLSDAAFQNVCDWFALVEARGGLGV